ncbi:MAG: ABC transporter permease [Actinomycetota bacterium]
MPVSFRYVGIVREFPTAPSDSFIVTKADYVARQTGSDAVGTFLVDTSGASPGAVAARLRVQLGTSARVTTIGSARRLVASSLTAVDLSGLTKIELGFALVLAAAATGLVFAAGLTERRRTFAILTALGAKASDLGGFVWTEAIMVGILGVVAGIASGSLLSWVLVKILTGVFDPPPSTLSVPWSYFGVVSLLLAGSALVSGWSTIRRMRSPAMGILRELT